MQLQTGCSIRTHGRACSIRTHYLCTFEHACTYICTCCSNTYFNSCEAELYCLAFNQECTLAKTKAMGHYQMQLGSLQLLILCPRDTCIYDTVEAHCCIIRECRGFFKQFHATYSTYISCNHSGHFDPESLSPKQLSCSAERDCLADEDSRLVVFLLSTRANTALQMYWCVALVSSTFCYQCT